MIISIPLNRFLKVPFSLVITWYWRSCCQVDTKEPFEFLGKIIEIPNGKHWVNGPFTTSAQPMQEASLNDVVRVPKLVRMQFRYPSL